MKSLFSRLRQYLKEVKYAPVERFIQSFVPSNRQSAWVRRYHGWRRSLYPKLQEQLRDIVARHSDPRAIIVFTPSLDWDRQLFQRPQQLAQALAKRGALVFYSLSSPQKDNSLIKPICERLYLCTLPLDQFTILDHFFAYSLTWNRKYLLKLNHPNLLYDYLDEITTFEGDTAQLIRDHSALLREADLITATAGLLYEDAKEKRPDALHIPNGVDFEHFHQGQELLSYPQDLTPFLGQGKSIVGFYGAFAHWFDYDLMVNLAAERDDIIFVLIGPKHDNSLEASKLLNKANIHYLGPKPYSELPAYLACFDVAILPFKINQVTQSASPIKLFEYFAGGKPVVSTPLREVMLYKEVLIGRDSKEFAEKIDEALSIKRDPAFVRRLQEIAMENTWENHAERILQAMEKKMLGSGEGRLFSQE